MLYLYYKRAHVGCLVTFILLALANAATLILTEAKITLSDNIDLVLLGTVPLVFYLIQMLIPEISYRITCKLISLFTKCSTAELREDTEIKKTFLRARFSPLLIEDLILLLIFFSLIPYLFK